MKRLADEFIFLPHPESDDRWQRSTKFFLSRQMADTELNVDSIISRLLEGTPKLLYF